MYCEKGNNCLCFESNGREKATKMRENAHLHSTRQNSTLSEFVVPSGIEPESRASETLILSIVLRDRHWLSVECCVLRVGSNNKIN